MESNKKLLLSTVGIAVLIVIVCGITFAFFNYTRTGLVNNIGTGEIYFNTTQGNTLNLTNLFPMSSSEAANSNLDSISINIIGDTTYNDGQEFEISLVDVNNTIISGSTEKVIPVNYTASYVPTPVATGETPNNIGTSSTDYFTERGGTTAVYKLSTSGVVSEGEQILVGYIPKDIAINGTLSIKVYLDANSIAVSDTYPQGDVTHTETSGETSVEVVDYTNKTTSEWANGRTVLTTSEWNSLADTPISFKVRAESKENYWVIAPAPELPDTIETCPGCIYAFFEDDANHVGYGRSVTNSTVSSYLNQNGFTSDYKSLIARTGHNYFLGFIVENDIISQEFACFIKNNIPFCIEGDSNSEKYIRDASLLQSTQLWNNSCAYVDEDYDPVQTVNDSYYVQCDGDRIQLGFDNSAYAGDTTGYCYIDYETMASCVVE